MARDSEQGQLSAGYEVVLNFLKGLHDPWVFFDQFGGWCAVSDLICESGGAREAFQRLGGALRLKLLAQGSDYAYLLELCTHFPASRYDEIAHDIDAYSRSDKLEAVRALLLHLLLGVPLELSAKQCNALTRGSLKKKTKSFTRLISEQNVGPISSRECGRRSEQL